MKTLSPVSQRYICIYSVFQINFNDHELHFFLYFNNKNRVRGSAQYRGEDVHKLYRRPCEGERLAGCISAHREVFSAPLELTGGAHSTTRAELNGLWSKGLIKRRRTTCPLALRLVRSGFVGKMMRAGFPARIGDLQRTSSVKLWGNKRCGLKIMLSGRLALPRREASARLLLIFKHSLQFRLRTLLHKV